MSGRRNRAVIKGIKESEIKKPLHADDAWSAVQKTVDIKGQAKAAPNSAGGEACPFLRFRNQSEKKAG